MKSPKPFDPYKDLVRHLRIKSNGYKIVINAIEFRKALVGIKIPINY